MKNFLTMFHLVGVVLSIPIFPVFSAEAGPPPKRIFCYFESTTFNLKHPYDYDTHHIPTELCTDLAYAFLKLDTDTWELETPRNEDKLRMLQFTSLGSGRLSAPNFFLSVTGDGIESRKWSPMMADASKRSSFVTSVVRRMAEFGFNGLDLDYMYPRFEDRENFVKLIEDLVNAFKKRGYLLSSTINLRQVVEQFDKKAQIGYDISRLSELLDYIKVMGQTLRGPWNNFVDVPTPLYRRPFDKEHFKHLNVHDGLNILGYLGAPRHKLLMGISFSGRTYTLRSSSETFLTAPTNTSFSGGDPGPITNSTGFMTYFEICRKLESGKWTRRFDHVGKCPYAFNGYQWVGYEDKQSIGNKMDLIKNMGYGGAYVWAINMDDFNGFCGQKNPLLYTMHEALIKKKEEYVDPVLEILRARYVAMGIIPQCTC